MKENHDVFDKLVLGKDEEVLWRGKPNKKAYVATNAWTMSLFFFAFCGIFVFMAIGFLNAALGDRLVLEMIITLVAPLLTIALVYLISAKIAGGFWKKTDYLMTNRRLIEQRGRLLRTRIETYYENIKTAMSSQGIRQRHWKVKTLAYSQSGQLAGGKDQETLTFNHLDNADEIAERIQKLICESR